MRAQFFNQGGAAMQNAYEDFLQFNRQNLIRAACAKQLTLAMTELSDIRGSQLLLTIASDKCLDALKNEDVTLEEIKRIYAGFAEFYTVICLNDRILLRILLLIGIPVGFQEMPKK